MEEGASLASASARVLLGKCGRALAFSASCVCFVGTVVSLVLQDWFYAGVNPLACFALAITFLALYVSLRIFALQEEQGTLQESRYLKLWGRIESTSEDAAASAAGANQGVARLIEVLGEAYKSRAQEYPSNLPTKIPRLYSELREAGSGLVLWVDDEPESVAWERAALSEVGIRSVCVTTTDDAYRLIADNDFDVIVTDMGRPDSRRAGYELLDGLRSWGDKTRVLVYSSSKKPEHVAEVLEHDGQGATNDPWEIIELVALQLRLANEERVNRQPLAH
ncbi:response regulator receiver domain-containing protein [Arthrobacter sp. AG1021]|nr:response regulator receiver domain-containing protein [Arthrobacter sp. AG1021]